MARRSSFSYEEGPRVRVLAGEGFTQREIAERVFGNRRLRGRVERILRRERARSADPELEFRELLERLGTLAAELEAGDVPDLDRLVDLIWRRSLQERLERGLEKVRVSELTALFGLELGLQQRRAYERIRRLSVHA